MSAETTTRGHRALDSTSVLRRGCVGVDLNLPRSLSPQKNRPLWRGVLKPRPDGSRLIVHRPTADRRNRSASGLEFNGVVRRGRTPDSDWRLGAKHSSTTWQADANSATTPNLGPASSGLPGRAFAKTGGTANAPGLPLTSRAVETGASPRSTTQPATRSSLIATNPKPIYDAALLASRPGGFLDSNAHWRNGDSGLLNRDTAANYPGTIGAPGDNSLPFSIEDRQPGGAYVARPPIAEWFPIDENPEVAAGQIRDGHKTTPASVLSTSLPGAGVFERMN